MRDVGFLLLLGALACADGDARAAVDAVPQNAADTVALQDSSTVETSRPLRLARLAEPAPSSFPHAPHLGFDCRRCHTHVPGHERHASVACRACHDAPAPAAAGASPTDCNSCHHARSQPLACTHCHERDQRLLEPRAVRIAMRLAGTGAERTVSFPHARHAQLECNRCHLRADASPARRSGDSAPWRSRPEAARPNLQAPAAQCATCHERHHTATADCAACHSAPRAGAHSADSHRGCGGSGCHQSAAVLALPLAPAVCLACHPAQAQHERGGDCAGCHNLRSGSGLALVELTRPAVAGKTGRP